MNKYESVVIINPSVTEEAMKELVTKYTDIINNEGKVESIDLANIEGQYFQDIMDI